MYDLDRKQQLTCEGAVRLSAVKEEADKVRTESQDALRISVNTEIGPHMETLTYYFPVVDADSAVLRLQWGTTIVPLKIKVTP